MVVMAWMVSCDVMLKRHCVQLASALSFRHMAKELFRNWWISDWMLRCLLEDGRDFRCYRFFWRMCFQIRASVMIGRNMGIQWKAFNFCMPECAAQWPLIGNSN